MLSIIDAWIAFFQNCGLHKDVHRRYAQRFVKERIQPTVLKDIGKSELSDLGVNILGDQLCILRYIKASNGVFDEFKTVNKQLMKMQENESTKRQIFESRALRSGNKIFYFDASHNNRGPFLKISEVKPACGYRSSITVSGRSLSQFSVIVNELQAKLSDLNTGIQRSKDAALSESIVSADLADADGDKLVKTS